MTEEKTYQQMRKEFQEHYFNIIAPKLMKFEAERKKRLSNIRRAAFILLPLSIVMPFVLLGMSTSGNPIFIEPAFLSSYYAFVIYAVISYFYYNSRKSFESSVKSEIMTDVCSCFSDLLWCDGMLLEDDLFFASHLIREYGTCHFDDVFTGSYKDTKFEIIETKISGSQKSKNSFDGVIIKVNMNKNFAGNTVIYSSSIDNFLPPEGLKLIKLEDINFSKKFDVYSNDEVEARYLVTPSFMERLMKMKTAFFAYKVRCAFYDEYLLIGLETTKDLFSLCSLTKPVNDGKQFFTMFEEILSIIKLIDHFKLDRKIGL